MGLLVTHVLVVVLLFTLGEAQEHASEDGYGPGMRLQDFCLGGMADGVHGVDILDGIGWDVNL